MPNSTNRQTAFAYVRVSVDDEAGNNASIASQKAAIAEYCAKENIQLLEIYEEVGVSGRTGLRKQFDRMISTATATDTRVDFIIAYAMSRFARRLETQVVSQQRLTDAGVRLLSLTEHSGDSNRTAVRAHRTWSGVTA